MSPFAILGIVLLAVALIVQTILLHHEREARDTSDRLADKYATERDEAIVQLAAERKEAARKVHVRDQRLSVRGRQLDRIRQVLDDESDTITVKPPPGHDDPRWRER